MQPITYQIYTADQLKKALDHAIVGLFVTKNSTFLSTIYCSLRMRWDDSIPTACTDGLKLWINPGWFMSLTAPMRVTLLAHEIWHVAFMHMARIKHRMPRTWNAACDHELNLMLLAHGYHFDTLPNGKMLGLADARFTGMAAEKIYDILVQENQPIDLPFGDDFTTPDVDMVMKPEQINDIIAVVLRATTAQRIRNGGGQGDLPGTFTDLIDEILYPQITWEEALSRWLTERSDSMVDWSRPNRRFQDIYLPSRGGEGGLMHLMWACDCSCSVTDSMLAAFKSEMSGAKEQYDPERMTVVSFDTQIQDTWEIYADDDLDELTFHGRGGTDMQPLFNLAAELRPEGLIIFSDMECGIPDPVPGVEVLWVCIDDPSWEAPYGTTLHLDSSQYSQA